MEDFDRLLADVHALGMKLIIDLVINHTSDEHPWFIESRSAKDSEKRDWYIWRDGKTAKSRTIGKAFSADQRGNMIKRPASITCTCLTKTA